MGAGKAGVRAVVGAGCIGRNSASAVLAKPVSLVVRSNLAAAAGGRSAAAKSLTSLAAARSAFGRRRRR